MSKKTKEEISVTAEENAVEISEQKFGTFNQEGLPTGFYSSLLHDEIPSGAIAITDDQWRDLVENSGLRKFVDGEVVEYTPPAPAPRALIYAQIATLEAQQTPRRLREAVLGVDEGFLASLNEEIQSLREQLAQMQ